MKKMFLVLVAIGMLIFLNSKVAKAEDMSKEQVKSIESAKPVDVGNKFCPVSGEKIKPGEDVKYEYEGKIYHFCCPACIKTFKEDPQKYMKKIEEEKAKAAQIPEKTKKMGQDKMMMHKKCCKALRGLTEIVGSLNEVKNNPELKQKLESIINEIKEMEGQCSMMMEKHGEEKEHKTMPCHQGMM